MKDKLAEEILKPLVFDDNILLDSVGELDFVSKNDATRAMQAYHEARLKEITDADIEAFADKFAHADSKKPFERGEWLGIKEGVRAMREGEIKHIEK